jgi:hypothetical protein
MTKIPMRTASMAPHITRDIHSLTPHNPKVVGSNPASATTKNGLPIRFKPFFFYAQKGQNLQVVVYLMFSWT